MWIEIKERGEYQDSDLRGLRVTFDKRIDEERKNKVKSFAKWLRKRYYFPIRCDVHICYCSYFQKISAEDVDSVGDFYYTNYTADEQRLPSIAIAGYPARKKDDKDFEIEIEARMVYFLTFYYQWYFYEFKERSDRSLKIEATKWQNYIMNQYLEEQENLKKPEKATKEIQ